MHNTHNHSHVNAFNSIVTIEHSSHTAQSPTLISTMNHLRAVAASVFLIQDCVEAHCSEAMSKNRHQTVSNDWCDECDSLYAPMVNLYTDDNVQRRGYRLCSYAQSCAPAGSRLASVGRGEVSHRRGRSDTHASLCRGPCGVHSVQHCWSSTPTETAVGDGGSGGAA